MAFALAGSRIFDGETFLESMAVVVEGRQIEALLPEQELPSSLQVKGLDGGLLAPGFIDVQVNGGGGALLNHAPNVDVVRVIADSHRCFGTTGMLPTVITDRAEVIASAIAAVSEARKQGFASVLGVHIEGPFIDAARKGAHDAALIRDMTELDVTMLSEVNCGSVMLTIAPNKVPAQMIRKLVEAGIHISLGHAEATIAEARAALDAGASSFTHLFNAMSQLTGREPGMVGAALSHERSFIGIIADGFHVDDVSLTLALASTPHSRFVLVTDAMPPAAGGPDSFVLQGRKVTRAGGRLLLADGTLAGSNLTMDAALRHAVNMLRVPLAHALQMASRNPARFLHRADLGTIKPGALASLVHLDDTLHVQQTWVEGK